MEINNNDWIHFALILVLAANRVMPQGNSDVKCESPWEKIQSSWCVHFVNSSETWPNARDKCNKSGAHLLTFREQVDALLDKLRKLDIGNRIPNWWIDMRYNENRLVDKGEVTRTSSIIKSGYPLSNVSNTDGCDMMDSNGTITSVNCSKSNAYICERTTASNSVITIEQDMPPLSTALPQATTEASPMTKRLTGTSSVRIYSISNLTKFAATSEVTAATKRKQTTNKTVAPEKTTDQLITTLTNYHDVTESTGKDKATGDKVKGCYGEIYEAACPSVNAFGMLWPGTEAGKTAFVICNKGQAMWNCNNKPVCWKDEPNVKGCTSENIQALVQQMELFTNDSGNSEIAVTFTKMLAAAVVANNALSAQDLFQVTQLLNAVALAKPQNTSVAKKILQNVIKCGSSLMANNYSSTWSALTTEDQRTIASSLLKSIESVTAEMVKAYTEPTIQTLQEDNMVVQLNVMNVNATTQNVIFQGESTSFCIPPENIRNFSSDGVVRIFFINYFNMAEILKPKDDNNSKRQVISDVLGASIGDKKNRSLLEPVTFTFKVNRSGYEDIEQHCAFWDFNLEYNGAWSYSGCTLQDSNVSHVICRCNHLTNFAILMNIHNTMATDANATTLSYITYVGIITSAICLFLSWVSFVFISVKCLRGSRESSAHANTPGKYEYYGDSSNDSGGRSRSIQGERISVHKHLVFCLFISEILFIAGIDRTDHKIACAVIAGVLHYFFLGSFMWMFLEGIHILFMLVQVFDAAASRLKYYYMIGYGCPLLIVAVSALVYHDGYGTEQYCWLSTERMFVWSFAGPVALILLINLVILIYAMSAVCRHSEYVFTKENSVFDNFKAWIQGALAMEVMLGLTWVFGYFYISKNAVPLAYLFTIFNSLQGVFIFVFYCLLNKKVRQGYLMLRDYWRRPISKETNVISRSDKGSDLKTITSCNTCTSQKPQEVFALDNSERRPSTKSSSST